MTEPIASLDMYCWPENQSLWEQFWQQVRSGLGDAGVEAPETLTFANDPYSIWESPSLLIGHTCGWPYISRLREKVTLVGTFDFGLPGLSPGFYGSVFIGRENMDPGTFSKALIVDDLVTIGVNSIDSQSGFRAFRDVLAEDPLKGIRPEQVVHTGSHRNSIIAVANGDADIAAIDAVTWEIAKQYEPACEDVAVLGRSKPVPGLPLITANGNEATVELLRERISEALTTFVSQLGAKASIGFPTSIVAVTPADYEQLL